MFSVRQKREIADAVHRILRDTEHPELPQRGKPIVFRLHVAGAEAWSWADIQNNEAVSNPVAASFAPPHAEEVWRPFRSGLYEASSYGRVRRAKQGKRGVRTTGRTHVGKILSQWLDVDGYLKCSLTSERPTSCGFYVHAVVAEAFHGVRPARLQVNHRDGLKINNRPENLEYVTSAENLAHATRLGLKARGERNRHAKLTTAQVLEIRRRRGQLQRVLAQEFGVNQGQISAILLRKTWAHV